MAKLTSKGRAKIPAAKFAGPNRSYPVEDKAHAKAAIGLSAFAVQKGTLSPAGRAKIVAKAEKVINKKKK